MVICIQPWWGGIVIWNLKNIIAVLGVLKFVRARVRWVCVGHCNVKSVCQFANEFWQHVKTGNVSNWNFNCNCCTMCMFFPMCALVIVLVSPLWFLVIHILWPNIQSHICFISATIGCYCIPPIPLKNYDFSKTKKWYAKNDILYKFKSKK